MTMQYKVETNGLKKTVDKERTARTLYGSYVRAIEKDESSGFVKLYERENPKSEWVLVLEFERAEDE